MSSGADPAGLVPATGEPGLDQPGFPGRLARWSRRVARVELLVVAVLFSVLMVVMLVGVFTRYVLNDPMTGTGEVSRFLYIWCTFLGASAGISYGREIRVDVLHVALRPLAVRDPQKVYALTRYANVTGATVALGFVLLLGWLALEYTRFQADAGSTASSLPLPMWVPNAALPVALFLSAFHYIAVIAGSWRGGQATTTNPGEAA